MTLQELSSLRGLSSLAISQTIQYYILLLWFFFLGYVILVLNIPIPLANIILYPTIETLRSLRNFPLCTNNFFLFERNTNYYKIFTFFFFWMEINTIIVNYLLLLFNLISASGPLTQSEREKILLAKWKCRQTLQAWEVKTDLMDCV